MTPAIDNLKISRRIFLVYSISYALIIAVSIVGTLVSGSLPDQVGGYQLTRNAFDVYVIEYGKYVIYSVVLYSIFYIATAINFEFYYQPTGIIFDRLIFIISAFHLYLMSMGYGSVLRDAQLSNWVFIKLSALLQPYFLILIYLYINIKSDRIFYKIILTMYFVSAFISGFLMTLLFYMAPIFIIRYNSFFSRNFIKIFIGLTFLAPFYRILKYLYTVNFDLGSIERIGIIDVYLQSFVGIIDRFNFINNSYLYSKYQSYFDELLSRVEFSPFFQSYFGNLICKIFTSSESSSINEYATYLIYNNFESYSFFPISSYFNSNIGLGMGLVLYLFGIVIFTTIISDYLDPTKHLLILSFVVIFVLGYSGWVWPLNNYVQALIVYGLLKKIVGYRWSY